MELATAEAASPLASSARLSAPQLESFGVISPRAGDPDPHGVDGLLTAVGRGRRPRKLRKDDPAKQRLKLERRANTLRDFWKEDPVVTHVGGVENVLVATKPKRAATRPRSARARRKHIERLCVPKDEPRKSQVDLNQAEIDLVQDYLRLAEKRDAAAAAVAKASASAAAVSQEASLQRAAATAAALADQVVFVAHPLGTIATRPRSARSRSQSRPSKGGSKSNMAGSPSRSKSRGRATSFRSSSSGASGASRASRASRAGRPLKQRYKEQLIDHLLALPYTRELDVAELRKRSRR